MKRFFKAIIPGVFLFTLGNTQSISIPEMDVEAGDTIKVPIILYELDWMAMLKGTKIRNGQKFFWYLFFFSHLVQFLKGFRLVVFKIPKSHVITCKIRFKGSNCTCFCYSRTAYQG